MIKLRSLTATAVLLLGLPFTAPAMMVNWDGPTGPLAPGELRTLSILVSDAAGWNLVGGGVEFDFDPAVVNVTNVTIVAPNEVGEGFMDPEIDNIAGTARSITFSTFFDMTTPFTLASVTFAAVGAGSSALQLYETVLNPFAGMYGDPMTYVGAVSERLGEAPIAFGSASLEVTPVPLPAAAWLLLSGLGGLGFVGRQRNSARQAPKLQM